jgi:hypothetical protein
MCPEPVLVNNRHRFVLFILFHIELEQENRAAFLTHLMRARWEKGMTRVPPRENSLSVF